MRLFTTLALLLLNSTLTTASADDASLDSYTWHKRLLLIFTPNQDHPEFISQNRGLAAVEADLVDRDLVVLRMKPGTAVTIDNSVSSTSNSDTFYQHFAIETGEFRVLLIGKDGTPKLTRSSVVATTDLFELIDSMPMRQIEMQSHDSSRDQD